MWSQMGGVGAGVPALGIPASSHIPTTTCALRLTGDSPLHVGVNECDCLFAFLCNPAIKRRPVESQSRLCSAINGLCSHGEMLDWTPGHLHNVYSTHQLGSYSE